MLDIVWNLKNISPVTGNLYKMQYASQYFCSSIKITIATCNDHIKIM